MTEAMSVFLQVPSGINRIRDSRIKSEWLHKESRVSLVLCIYDIFELKEETAVILDEIPPTPRW